MNFLLNDTNDRKTDLFVIGVLKDNLPKNLHKFLKDSDIEFLHKCKKLHPKDQDILHIINESMVNFLLVQIKDEYDLTNLRKTINKIAKESLKLNLTNIDICLPDLTLETPDKQLETMVLNFAKSTYQFLDFKTEDKNKKEIDSVNFIVDGANQDTIQEAMAKAEGLRLTRNLGNLPGNVCTPTYLAEAAKKLKKEHKNLTVAVLEEKHMAKLGMELLLSVGRGSEEPSKLIEIKYQGAAKDKKPIVLVGKGITFDSGGLSLKPAEGMVEMKFDMLGAATVFGVMKALALLELPINVIGVIASAENMPGNKALKPGDIITSMSGQTVEITNTDAEGRLVLADALTYVEQYDPEMVIDIATLTGAMIIALGYVYTGFMTKDDKLAKRIEDAAVYTGDKAWRLPLDDDYAESLKSNVADMVNAPQSRDAGSIKAALMLAKFTQKYPWAHMDIAGTAWVTGNNKDATGRPVELFIELLSRFAYES